MTNEREKLLAEYDQWRADRTALIKREGEEDDALIEREGEEDDETVGWEEMDQWGGDLMGRLAEALRAVTPITCRFCTEPIKRGPAGLGAGWVGIGGDGDPYCGFGDGQVHAPPEDAMPDDLPWVVEDAHGVSVGDVIPTIGTFATQDEGAAFISTLPDYDSGRYRLTGPSEAPIECPECGLPTSWWEDGTTSTMGWYCDGPNDNTDEAGCFTLTPATVAP